MIVKEVAIEDSYQLSPMQEGMLFHSLLAPKSGAYIEQMVITVPENLDVTAFMQAWRRVVERHPVLRTAYYWENQKEPLQNVHRHVILPLEQYDWRNLPYREQDNRLKDYLGSDRLRGFDLAKAPLMRLALFQWGESHYKLIWTFHHILLDGSSFPLVLKEVFTFYEAFCQGQDCQLKQPRPYRDYIEWLQQQDWFKAQTYWRQVLKGFMAPTPLVVDQIRRVGIEPEENYTEQEIRLSVGATSALQSLVEQHELTVNTLVQGAWALLLSRYSGEADVVFGATRRCRRSAVQGTESMVGLFINTLPVRVRVSPELSVLTWLKELRTQWITMREYEHTPLVKVQEWSDVPAGIPLFESILVFENSSMNSTLRAQGGRWENLEFQLQQQTNYPLTVAGYLEPELLLKISYDCRRFDDSTIARMLGHVKTLLESMATNPAQRLSELPLLTAAERQLLEEWNNTQADYPKNACIHQLFEAQVERTPDAVAVVFEDESLTYRELNTRANQLAHYLQALGVGPEVLVGICLERSWEMVVGLLGILKAGGAYVPLDPAYPPERLAFMLEDSQVSVLLTQQHLVETLPAHGALTLCLDTSWETNAYGTAMGLTHQVTQTPNVRNITENPTSSVTSDNLAYVIYTSGSTGQPKGVMVAHEAICNQLFWRQTTFDLSEADRILQTIPISFDPSVWQIFGPLVAGAQLIVAPPGAHQDSAYLVRLMAKYQITIVDFVPSMLKVFLEEPELETCRSLRHVFCGGEPLPVEVCEIFKARLKATLSNQYGPTEACIDTTFARFAYQSYQNIVPIGRPMANKQVYVLDSHRQPLPIGVPGELYIGGGLARGYLNRPELTTEKFIVNPFTKAEVRSMKDELSQSAQESLKLNSSIEASNSLHPSDRLYKSGDLVRYLPDGNLEFLGRIDHQVKIRGFRIELGEIEAVLSQHPAVYQSAVIPREDVPGDKRLVAYVVPNQEQAPTINELHLFLKQKLPNYMVPAAIVLLEVLPLTPNGKVDRRALPAPNQVRQELEETFVAPRNELELQLSIIWAKVLSIQPIGVRDNFFEMGGNSLLAMRLLTQVEKTFGKNLSLATLLQAATVEQMASLLSQSESSALGVSLVPIQSGGSKPPFFCVSGAGGTVIDFADLARHLGEAQPFYGLQPPYQDGVQKLYTQVETLAAHYINEIRAVQPEGPYRLGGFCTGGVVAFEMAQQLQAQGQKVSRLVLLNTSYPVPTNFLYRGFRSFTYNLLYLKRFVVHRLGKLAKSRPGDRLSYILKMATTVEQEDFFWAQIGATLHSLRNYRPQAYSGRITLFLATEEPKTRFYNPKNWGEDPQRWGELAIDGLEVHTIPSDHGAMIGPLASVLAEQLRPYLDEAQADDCSANRLSFNAIALGPRAMVMRRSHHH